MKAKKKEYLSSIFIKKYRRIINIVNNMLVNVLNFLGEKNRFGFVSGDYYYVVMKKQ